VTQSLSHQSLTIRPRPLLASVAVLAMAGSLAGCGGVSQITSGIGGGLFGGSETTQSTTPAVTETDLLSAAQLDNGGSVQTAGVPAMSCPKVDVWDQDQHFTVYEGGQAGDGLAVIHRGEITKTARECQIRPGEIVVKYGFSGRVLLGPRGAPGQVVLPVTVHVTDPNRERIQADQMTVTVDVPADKPIGYFSMVRVVSIPVVEGTRPAEYKLYVAFDRAGTAG